MKTKSKNVAINIIVPVFTIIVSFSFGLIFKDYYLGPITLIFAFLGSFYMAKGKWYGYLFGLIQCVLNAVICFINGLYATVIFSALIYLPMQIFGIINWNKNQQNNEVKIKKLSVKKTVLLIIIICIVSVVFGYLLSLIPSQNLAYLDSVCQVINVFGVLLNVLRFRESWIVWLINNLINEVIWIINVTNHTPNAAMMLINSTMFLTMNIISIISWIKIERKQKLESVDDLT